MASSDSIHNVKICSFNMHGFNTGQSMARTLCKSYDIIMLQEHWLLKDTLTNLNLIDTDFAYVGVSSMSRKASLGLIHGRPFGGVAILWRKSLSVLYEVQHKSN
jgi:exonuclease III